MIRKQPSGDPAPYLGAYDPSTYGTRECSYDPNALPYYDERDCYCDSKFVKAARAANKYNSAYPIVQENAKLKRMLSRKRPLVQPSETAKRQKLECLERQLEEHKELLSEAEARVTERDNLIAEAETRVTECHGRLYEHEKVLSLLDCCVLYRGKERRVTAVSHLPDGDTIKIMLNLVGVKNRVNLLNVEIPESE